MRKRKYRRRNVSPLTTFGHLGHRLLIYLYGGGCSTADAALSGRIKPFSHLGELGVTLLLD